ncbi:MAG: group III truncated hemoglobin [Rhodomicrobium sp.]
MSEATAGASRQALDNAEIEAAIEACVRAFYAKGRNDDLLGPVFNAAVGDWESHIGRIQDFWSKLLLGTARYSGHPYPAHVPLPVEPEHFTRWIALFEETARETLDAELAQKTIGRARHMSVSFQAGIFPFKDRHGRPSRLPTLGKK